MRLWLALLLVPLVTAQPQLSAVVPDFPGAHDNDEAVAITSPTPWDLTGYGLTDGEDTWWFPDGAVLAANQETWIVGNASAWAQYDGPPPAWTFDLRLGNGGDDVALLGPEGVVDAMVYDDGGLSGQAQVLRRDDDWITPRIHRLGESALDQPTFVANVTAYASPDSSHATLTALMDGAERRLHLHVYELLSQELVESIVAAARRGVDVQVLVEDHPVGLDADGRNAANHALERIAAAGGETYRAGSVRYGFHHLKVLVVDNAVAVQSENWVATGVPQDPSWGNRGWGAVVKDAPTADWFATWMAADRAAWDTEQASPRDAPEPLRFPVASGAYRPVAPALFGNVVVQPFISPDHTANPAADPVLEAVRGARRSIDVQQLDMRLEATNRIGWAQPDGMSVALAEAAERGVSVRVQAASPFHRDDTGNREVMAWLAERGVQVGEMDRPGIVTLHNKGIIIDEQIVVLGSMNGNHHSRSNNREAGLILHSPDVAAYYTALFDSDWVGDTSIDWHQVERDLREVPLSPWPILLALTAVVCFQRCCRSSPT